MHRTNYYLCLVLLCLTMGAFAQTKSEKQTVFIDIASFSDDSVSFSWSNFSINTTDIYRKKISEKAWTALVTGSTSTTYTDLTIAVGTEYEYKFQVNTNVSSPSVAYGYIAFGVKVPKKDNRGNLLVLLDDRYTSSLDAEIFQLQKDLLSDGWNPILGYCNKDSSVSNVKSIIDSINTANTLSAIYMLGHIPVPYSGVIAPDGHSDHLGAWPTDLYYVSNSATWTDNSANHTNTSKSEYSNVPNDGKFDVSYLSSQINCPISRVDFYDLPGLNGTEYSMLQNYLIEASKYKNGQVAVKESGLIDNRIVNTYEGFASNGYKNFNSLFGDSVVTGPMISSLEANTHKWTYAVGYGTDTSMSSIGSISTFDNSSYKGIFSMTFGSYFGEWNKQNNLMRSLLADGKMLTTCWAGRPNWFFHHMGLNNPIALSSKMSIENGAGWSPVNATDYDVAGYGQNNVHMQLLGDLSLRQNYTAPVQGLEVGYNVDSNYLELEWDVISNTGATSIEIYKSSDSASGYSLINTLTATDTEYIDTSVQLLNYYYIKYISLDTTHSGSYYNNSIGTFTSLDTSAMSATGGPPVPVELMSFTATKVNEDGELNWTTATELNVSHFKVIKSQDLKTWETVGEVTGSGTTFSMNSYGLIDYNLGTGKTYYKIQTVDYDGSEEESEIAVLENKIREVVVYPNPTTDNAIYIKTEEDLNDRDYDKVYVTNLSGLKIPIEIDRYSGRITINAGKGVYFVRILGETKRILLL